MRIRHSYVINIANLTSYKKFDLCFQEIRPFIELNQICCSMYLIIDTTPKFKPIS